MAKKLTHGTFNAPTIWLDPIKFNHHFALNNQLPKILADVTDLKGYLKNLRTYAATLRLGDDRTEELRAIGDGFELFGEFLVKVSIAGHDDRLFVTGYKMLDISDNGVDAEAIDSRDGRPVFFQYKCYNEHEILSGHKSHIDSFVAECCMIMQDRWPNPAKYPFTKYPRMIVITSAGDIARYTHEEKFRSRLEVLPVKQLFQRTADPIFWDNFRASVSVRKSYKRKPKA